MSTQLPFFDLTTLLMAFTIALALIALFRKLRAIKNLTWFLLGLAVAYILFFTGLGDVVLAWLRELVYGSLAVSSGLIMLVASSRPIGREREEWPEVAALPAAEEEFKPEDLLLTFGIGPVLIFALLAGLALCLSLPMFFGQAGGGAAEAFEAFGDAIKLAVSELGFLALYIMPALVAVLPVYVLRHKQKLTFIAFGCVYGLLLTFILFRIGFVDVMVQTFTSLYGSWAAVPASVTSSVLSGFILRMIDEWIAALKRPRRGGGHGK